MTPVATCKERVSLPGERQRARPCLLPEAAAQDVNRRRVCRCQGGPERQPAQAWDGTMLYSHNKRQVSFNRMSVPHGPQFSPHSQCWEMVSTYPSYAAGKGLHSLHAENRYKWGWLSATRCTHTGGPKKYISSPEQGKNIAKDTCPAQAVRALYLLEMFWAQGICVCNHTGAERLRACDCLSQQGFCALRCDINR